MTAAIRSRARRGFTLVELMVAVTGGLFVSIAVFTLAKHSTSFYQAEGRVGNATYSQIVGFDRLRADIARAGYLVSPNVRRDPALCGTPTGGGWPAWLSRLASVFIDKVPTGELTDDVSGRAPDRITLAGSYSSADQFETGPIVAGAGNNTVFLRPNSAAMIRLGYVPTGAGTNAAILAAAFPTGRILRIVDVTGREQYGVITGTSAATALEPQVTINDSTPSLQFRAGNALRCGVNGDGTGSLANVVNIIRYTVRAPTTGLFARVVGGANAPATDAGRAELIREELDSVGNQVAGTEEIVAEYAVDLQFGITVPTAITQINGIFDQTGLETHEPGSSQIVNFAGNPANIGSAIGPQNIRSIRARLGIRSREADRESDVVAAANLAPGLYRVGLPVGSGGTGGMAFARVRTAQADIALRNQLGVMWQ